MQYHREAGEFKKIKLKVLARLTKLRQICCDPRLHYEDYKAGSAKLDTCMELVRGALNGGHRTCCSASLRVCSIS